MNWEALKTELAKPGYAGLDDQATADAVNAKTVTVRQSRLITKTTIYRTLGFTAGLQLFGTFKALSANSDPAIALQFSEILDLLNPRGEGIDVSLDEVRGVIDQLTVQQILTNEQAAAIKALGEVTSSWLAANCETNEIHAGDVKHAREM